MARTKVPLSLVVPDFLTFGKIKFSEALHALWRFVRRELFSPHDFIFRMLRAIIFLIKYARLRNVIIIMSKIIKKFIEYINKAVKKS